MAIVALHGSALGRDGSRFRPRPAYFVLYLVALLAIELLAENAFSAGHPTVRALLRWSILALAVAPALYLVARRGLQADEQLAAVAERDRVIRLTRLLATEEDPAQVPNLLLRQLRELSGARLAFLARPDGDAFVVDLVQGEVGYRLVGTRVPINPTTEGIGGEVVRSKRTMVLPDTWCDLGLASRRELALSDKIRSAAVVPLVLRGELSSLVVLHAEALGQFDQTMRDVLQSYAEQAVGSYENAILSASVSQLDQARQLEQLKSEFLSAVAHELKAPLSPMIGWSELLLMNNYSPEQARPMLEHIHQGAQHMAVLVNDLMDLSRGEAGRLKLEVEELDFGDLIRDAVNRAKQQAPEHNFVVAIAGSIVLNGDRHRLRQVLDNLLSNATKYSPTGSRVFVTARAEGNGQVHLRVSDQGLGMTREELQQLFSKFYRTESARKSASGTGLGLALTRLIAEAHGGQAHAESDGPGQGSAFTITLPVSGPAAERGQASASFAAVRG